MALGLKGEKMVVSPMALSLKSVEMPTHATTLEGADCPTTTYSLTPTNPTTIAGHTSFFRDGARAPCANGGHLPCARQQRNCPWLLDKLRYMMIRPRLRLLEFRHETVYPPFTQDGHRLK
jgi:hypothetical protein